MRTEKMIKRGKNYVGERPKLVEQVQVRTVASTDPNGQVTWSPYKMGLLQPHAR